MCQLLPVVGIVDRVGTSYIVSVECGTHSNTIRMRVFLKELSFKSSQVYTETTDNHTKPIESDTRSKRLLVAR